MSDSTKTMVLITLLYIVSMAAIVTGIVSLAQMAQENIRQADKVIVTEKGKILRKYRGKIHHENIAQIRYKVDLIMKHLDITDDGPELIQEAEPVKRE